MDKKLNGFFRDYLETEFRDQLLEATRLGDHRFDSLLDNLSHAALEARRVRASDRLAPRPQRKMATPSAIP